MNKKILAAAIAAAAILPMGAQAGVQIYGVIHASIDYIDNNTNDMDFWDVTSNTSRIGFKGAEDLGNGLKAIWKVESGVQVTDSSGTNNGWSTRNAYIGLAGDWGTFLYGRHDTPLKISTGSLDLFADRTADYNLSCPGSNGYGCGGFTDRRQSDAIAYISPNMNGLTFAAAIIPGHDAGFGADGLADGYSAALMYSNNGLFVSLAYEDVTDWTNDVIDDSIWRVGLGYDINAFHIGFVYENEDLTDNAGVTDLGAGGTWDADKYQVSASYTFGNNVVKGMYQWFDVTGEDVSDQIQDLSFDEDGTAWAIGLDHNLSKRTTAYLLYTDVDMQDAPALYAGMHNYGNVNDGSGFSMGMIHKF